MTNHPTQLVMLPKDIQVALAGIGKTRIYYRDVSYEIRQELWRRYREAIAPLKEAGKLHLVHFQFPPWLLRNREGHEHVRHCVEIMAGHTVSVEFRNMVSLEGEHRISTLAFDRELGVVHTVTDSTTTSLYGVNVMGRRRRRRRSAEFKAAVIQECMRPGVSIAAAALAHSLNANGLRKWVIDELHLEHPFAGSRMLCDLLRLAGIEMGRRHVGTLMRRMGIQALYRKPNTSKRHPAHPVFPYLLRGLAIERATTSGRWTSPTSRWRAVGCTWWR